MKRDRKWTCVNLVTSFVSASPEQLDVPLTRQPVLHSVSTIVKRVFYTLGVSSKTSNNIKYGLKFC